MSIKAVRQERSQVTLETLLDAAERLGARKSFDQITVNEIAAAAGFSIGAFYARFADKEALLHGLEERLRSLIEQERESLEATRKETTVVQVRVERLVARVAMLYKTRRGLMLLLRSEAASDAELAGRINGVNRIVLDLFADAIGHGLPFKRIHLETAVLLLTTSLRELVLKREMLPDLGASDDGEGLRTEIARAITAYLTDASSRADSTASGMRADRGTKPAPSRRHRADAEI